MVKFGGHVEAIRNGDLLDSKLYLLQYNDMKKRIEQREHSPLHPQQQVTEGELQDAINTDTDTAAVVIGVQKQQQQQQHEKESELESELDDNQDTTTTTNDASSFLQSWKQTLQDAEDDFRNARATIWETVFEGITAAGAGAATNTNDDTDTETILRGVHPGNAIKLYVQIALQVPVQVQVGDPEQKNNNNNNTNNNDVGVGGNKAQELLVRMQQVYTAASINSEGLRKIVKKFDKNLTTTKKKKKKNHTSSTRSSTKQQKPLSSTLLPLLYTSSLYTSQNIMYDGIGLLRDLLSEEYTPTNGKNNQKFNYNYNYTYNSHDTDNDDHPHTNNDDNDDNNSNNNHQSTFIPLVKRRDSDLRHQESVDIRMREIEWLKNLVTAIRQRQQQQQPAAPVDLFLLLPKLVAHRGFHNTQDRNDRRPVENSLAAFEMAWTSGIELCECDIALTKDEKLVLAHDENFQRLALYGTQSVNATKRIQELTYVELISMPLTSGARPPLLIDVLRSASAISEQSQLIIEIKPGNEVSALALARLLSRHPDLRPSVAMIMSFDASTMHRLRADLSCIALPSLGLQQDDATTTTTTTKSSSNSRKTMLADVDTTTVTTTAPNTIHNSHRRVTSYDHFGTMSSGWLAGMGISSQPAAVAVAGGGGGGQHGLLPSSTSGGTIGSSNCMNNPSHDNHNHNHNHAWTSIDSHSSIGLSISQMNFNDATPTPTPTGGVLSAAASTSPATTSSAPFHLHGKSNAFSSAGKSSNGLTSSGTMPKLMLLTVADPPHIACELQVHYHELHRVIPWLTGTPVDNDDTRYNISSSLDGVYLQYEKEMLTPKGAAYLRELSKHYLIGIWGYADIDPDDFETFEVCVCVVVVFATSLI